MSDSNCRLLQQKYLELQQQFKSLNQTQKNFLHENSVFDTKAEDLYQSLSALGQSYEKYVDEFGRSALELMALWQSKSLATIQIEEGRIVYQGDIDFWHHRFSIMDYFPALIKRVEGTVFLPETINTIDYLEKADGLVYSRKFMDVDFSAKRVKSIGQHNIGLNLDFIKGKIDLPALIESGNVSARNATQFNAPNLQKARIVIVSGRVHLNALTQAERIYFQQGAIAELEKLSIVDFIFVEKPKKCILKNLKKTSTLYLCNLPYGISFRDCFPAMEDVDSIEVNQQRVYDEVQAIRGKGLNYTQLERL